ncbi:hypothetical protein [Amphibacillus jilinensis]|uniref:hypothetical protein n=1 Tax=Amphibacillus jilinensis TaxID=1216008 RepID=UPI0002EE949D|nr:hypothetical protein [Amphibacillus jilinensis]
MTNAMVQMYFRKERFKDNLIQKVYDRIEGYNAPPLWAIVALIVLAALAIVVVTAASIWCMRRGYRFFGVDWKRGNAGQVGVGCLR